MIIYYSFILEIIMFGVLLRVNKSNRWRLLYCSVIGFSLFIIPALRGITVGGDSFNYADMFDRIRQLSYMEILHSGTRDIGFQLLAKTIGVITASHQLLFAFVAAVFSFSVTLLIYNYSTDVILSFLIIPSFNFMQFSMTGLRQTMAMSIVIFALLLIFKDRKFWALCIIILAAFFHSSAIVYLITIPASYVTINRNKQLFAYGFATLFFINRSSIAHLISRSFFTGIYDYLSSGGGEMVLLVLILVMISFSVIYASYEKKNKNASLLYIILFTGMIFQILTPVQNIFFRVSMYFTLILVILLPSIVSVLSDKKTKYLARVFIYSMVLTQYFVFTKNGAYVTPYHFFWE